MKKIVVLLLVLAMALSLFACGKESNEPQTTTAAATQPIVSVKPRSSANEPLKSDYVVEKVDNVKVAKGTSYEDVIAMLPTELTVDVPADFSAASQELYRADFSSLDAFSETMTMCDADKVADVYDGKYVTTAASTRAKMFVNYQDWAKYDPDSEENNEFANYAVKAVLRGTADEPTNNFGIIFRATDVTDSGADSYYGLYVGIGDSSGSLCLGYAQNNWNSIKNIDIDYTPNTDYTLEVLVFNENYIVLLNGEQVYDGDCKGFVNGTVGLRTYNQLYECSEFTVRTLGPDDYAKFGGYTEKKVLPVTWSCTDYNPEQPGKYGFFATVNSDLITTGVAMQKILVTVNAN